MGVIGCQAYNLKYENNIFTLNFTLTQMKGLTISCHVQRSVQYIAEIVLDNQIMQLSDPVRVRLGSHSDGGLRGDNEKAFIKTIL